MPLQNGLPSIIKSVQTGSTNCPTPNLAVSVPISTVNTAKSMILLNGVTNSTAISTYLKFVTSNTIEVTSSNSGAMVHWTIIEYA